MQDLTSFDPTFVSTTFTIDGYRIVKHLGVVRGIIVRSRSIVGNFGAAIQTLFGGNISLYTSMCEKARQHSFKTSWFSTRWNMERTRS